MQKVEFHDHSLRKFQQTPGTYPGRPSKKPVYEGNPGIFCENPGVCSRGLLESSWTLTNDNGSCVKPVDFVRKILSRQSSHLCQCHLVVSGSFPINQTRGMKKTLVGGFNPFEKLSSIWIISPGIGVKIKKSLSCHHPVIKVLFILGECGGFLKWWYPTTMGFPTKNDHFGVFWGYHNFRKRPCQTDGRFKVLHLCLLQVEVSALGNVFAEPFWMNGLYCPSHCDMFPQMFCLKPQCNLKKT